MFTRYPRKALWVGTASVALLAAARFYGPPHAAAPATVQAVAVATPPGITLQPRASDVKVRDFLAVRGRDGQPCRACGTKIRAVRVGDGDACFCPRCQPAARKLFVDWAKLPPSE